MEVHSSINEIEQPRKDGSIVNTEVTTSYIPDEAGRIKVIGVSRDITLRKRMEAANALILDDGTADPCNGFRRGHI